MVVAHVHEERQVPDKWNDNDDDDNLMMMIEVGFVALAGCKNLHHW
jgi:hypothetical protein